MTHTIAIKTSSRWTHERVPAVDTDDACLEDFLKRVERRALRMAELATGDREEALDLVQEAMFGFVRHYANKPALQWPPLFYRVLDSRLNDWYRRRQVRQRWMLPRLRIAEHDDEMLRAPDTTDPGPVHRVAGSEAAFALDLALSRLPLRQRQAFVLRIWEGFDVADTARAMRCSQGTVKTHLSRAMAALRRALEEYA